MEEGGGGTGGRVKACDVPREWRRSQHEDCGTGSQYSLVKAPSPRRCSISKFPHRHHLSSFPVLHAPGACHTADLEVSRHLGLVELVGGDRMSRIVALTTLCSVMEMTEC